MRLRVGIDGHMLTGKHQGSRTFTYRLLYGLVEEGLAENVVVFSEDPDALAIEFPSLEHHRIRPCSSARRVIFEVPAAMERAKVDVGVYTYVLPPFSRVPGVVIIHDVLPMTHRHLTHWTVTLRRWLFSQRTVREARLIGTISGASATSIRRLFPYAAEKVRVLSLGPSFSKEAYTRATPGPGHPYILTVGRIEERKNVHKLAEAFLRADLPGVNLVVAGSLDAGFGWTPPDDARIQVRSGLSDEQLVELYQGASLFVFPSSAEGFGIPLLDATLFGLPTISSNLTSMPEVGRGLAVYFNPDAPDGTQVLADMIRNHFTNRPVPAPTDAQIADQRQRFSWRTLAKEFATMIDDLA